MEYKIENFILEYDNFLEKEYCGELITYYEHMKAAGFTNNRITDNKKRHQVSDNHTGFHGANTVRLDYTKNLSNYFLDNFWSKAYSVYAEKYSILSDMYNHIVRAIKLQKTEIGEGYHIWHSEISSPEQNSRILSYIMYLNDVNEGGETEFLYYPKRINAKTGKLLLFPAHFTHTHRGNPPISNEKYIITGWVEF